MKVCKCSKDKKEESLIFAGDVTEEGVYEFVSVSYKGDYLIVVGRGATLCKLFYSPTYSTLDPLLSAVTQKVRPCNKTVCFELKD